MQDTGLSTQPVDFNLTETSEASSTKQLEKKSKTVAGLPQLPKRPKPTQKGQSDVANVEVPSPTVVNPLESQSTSHAAPSASQKDSPAPHLEEKSKTVAGLPQLPKRPKPTQKGQPDVAKAEMPSSPTSNPSETQPTASAPEIPSAAKPLEKRTTTVTGVPPLTKRSKLALKGQFVSAKQEIPSGPVLDPSEAEDSKEIRKDIHEVRVKILRISKRLGYDNESALVQQVLYRLNLAEKLKAPWRRVGKRPDPVEAASRDANQRDEQDKKKTLADSGNENKNQKPGYGSGRDVGEGASGAPVEEEDVGGPGLDVKIKMLMIGPQGVGKTQLALRLLGSREAVDPFDGATRKVRVLSGRTCGMDLEIIDTPGLVLSASSVAGNAKVLGAIRKIYEQQKPDIVVYVDRLDALPGAGGVELPVLRAISARLGPQVWLNTIIAFTHGNTPAPRNMRPAAAAAAAATKGLPAKPKQKQQADASKFAPEPSVTALEALEQSTSAPMYVEWLEKRSQKLQALVCEASGDERLMNPVAFAECHPDCRRDARGRSVLLNGLAWRRHALLMLASAKVLADTEAALQKHGGDSGSAQADSRVGPSGDRQQAAEMLRQMFGGDAAGQMGIQLPLTNIMNQLLQPIAPLKLSGPMKQQAKAVNAERVAALTAADVSDEERREMLRQIREKVVKARQARRLQQRMTEAVSRGAPNGVRLTPEPPRIATRSRPSASPMPSYRYQFPEPPRGWAVRPLVESTCIDGADGIEGFSAEVQGAFGGDGLATPAVPFHQFVSAQCTKEAMSLAARSEATFPHGGKSLSIPSLLGRAKDKQGCLDSTSLSLDVQTSGGGGGGGGLGMGTDFLLLARADIRMKPSKTKIASCRGTVRGEAGGSFDAPLLLPAPASSPAGDLAHPGALASGPAFKTVALSPAVLQNAEEVEGGDRPSSPPIAFAASDGAKQGNEDNGDDGDDDSSNWRPRPKLTVGLVASKLVQGGTWGEGPAALGARVQAVRKGVLADGLLPIRGMLAAAVLQPLYDIQAGSDPAAVIGSSGAAPGGLRSACVGLSADLSWDLSQLLDLRHSLPMSLGLNAGASPSGDRRAGVTAGASLSAQYQLGSQGHVGVRANVRRGGRCVALNVKLQRNRGAWVGIVVALFPLSAYVRDHFITYLRAKGRGGPGGAPHAQGQQEEDEDDDEDDDDDGEEEANEEGVEDEEEEDSQDADAEDEETA